jgi:hypothetical protein
MAMQQLPWFALNSANTQKKGVRELAHELEVEVFRAGDYSDKGCYTPEDIDALVRDYDPQLHEAPVTIDHLQSGPAFGWVRSLRRAGDLLIARLKGLNEQFQGLLRQGAFKKRSVELYQQFQQTGRPYLRAVSFLGARIPEVKGLADPIFHDEGEFVAIDFAEPEATTTESDQPDVTISGEESQPPANVAITDEDASCTNTAQVGEEDAALRQLQHEKEQAEQELASLRQTQRRAQLQAFCQSLKHQGKFLPAWEKLGIVDFLESLDDLAHNETATAVSCFGESDTPTTALEWFKAFLAALPPLVPLGEVARDDGSAARRDGRIPQPTPQVSVSRNSIELHRKALAFQEQNPGLSYVDALKAAAKEY